MSYFHKTNFFQNYSNVLPVFEVGEPYSKTLQGLYCARTLILGISSMNGQLFRNPNTKPKETHLYSTPLVCNSGTSSSDYKTEPMQEVYVYRTQKRYTPFFDWDILPEQEEEMLSFHSGFLEECDLDIFTTHLTRDDVGFF